MRYEINQRYNSRRDRCTDDDVVHQNDSADSGCNAEHCREDYRNPHGGRLALLRADVPAVKSPAESVGVLVEVSVVAPRIVLVELEDTYGSRYVSAVGLEGNAGAHDKVDAVNVADEGVDVVVAEGRRNDIAARLPCRELTEFVSDGQGNSSIMTEVLPGLSMRSLFCPLSFLVIAVSPLNGESTRSSATSGTIICWHAMEGTG